MDDGDHAVKHLAITGVKFSDRELENYPRSRVFAVKYNEIACIAKEISFSKWDRKSHSEIKQDFLQECVQHSKLDHPNIVKMLGVYYPKLNVQSVLPVLVMEQMECTLTQLFDRYQNIPMSVYLSILQDVSRAICYLHTSNPPLMHRDLNSNNILLTASLVAKVSNFSVLKVVSPLSSEKLTREPGTMAFMPPEALEDDPHYGLPLDVFSFGCVICHMMAQHWPAPKYPFYGSALVNRREYINQIRKGSLKQLMIACLDDDPERRPTISRVIKRITSIITGVEPDCYKFISDHYPNDDNTKMAFALAIKEGEAESRDLQVLLVGAENTGKTCLASSFFGEIFIEGQPATEGAEVEVCKIYSKNWSRISESDKTNLLHHQFIYQFRVGVLKTILPFNPDDRLPEDTGYSFRHCTGKVIAPLTNPTGKDLPEPHPQDVVEVSSNTVQYDADSLNAVVWDFPGQVIYHNSHSVFISESGVPVITFNASGELSDEVVPREGSPQPAECRTVISSIHYWLQVVDIMCSVKGKVLLAGTHIDKIHRNVKKARKIAKEKILPQLENELHGKSYARCLFGYSGGLLSALEQCCYFISNKCRDKEIEDLKNTAIKVASSLRQKQPIFFLKIERALLQLKEAIISISMMLDEVTKVTFPIAKNSSELDSILRYFHDKRTILYFSGIESLRDLVILSPNWLAKLFSYVIAARSYKKGTAVDGAWDRLTKYGILEESLLRHMLDKFHSDYPSVVCVTKQQVVDILLSFHLVARITKEAWFSEEGYPSLPDSGDTFIVPSLVPRDDGKNIPNNKQERIIYFRFASGFIPTSLLNQLIADCICRNVKKKNRLLWMRHGKMGLQLGSHQKYYISRCEEKQSIQLTITVKGDDKGSVTERKELIDDVTQLLNDIMEVFMPEVKKPTLMVPCPLCPLLHITLSEVSTGDTIFCPLSDDAPLCSAGDQLSVYCDQMTTELTAALNSTILTQDNAGHSNDLQQDLSSSSQQQQTMKSNIGHSNDLQQDLSSSSQQLQTMKNRYSRPAKKHLHEHVLPSVSTRWYELGLELLDPKDEYKLGTIEKDSKIEGVEICCKKMFDKWLEYDNVSWNQLIQAIRKIGLKHAASEIEKLFKEESTPKDTTAEPSAKSSSEEDKQKAESSKLLSESNTGHGNDLQQDLSSSNQQLQTMKRPNMRLLHEIVVPRIAADWSMVADYLGYELEYKRLIREKYCDNAQRCCVELLEDWLSSNRGVSPKSWSKLIEVLSGIKNLKATTEKIVEDLATAGIIV